jgi:glutathione S-transferase
LLPTVYGANASPFVRKVRVFLAEKGLPYHLEPVFPFNPTPEYKKMSPLGKIPAYQEGDVTLSDSKGGRDKKHGLFVPAHAFLS